jgi:hypothetical protein
VIVQASAASNVGGRKRRSTRIHLAIPLTVTGADAYRAPYEERVSTQELSCHGCRYTSKYDVFQGQQVALQLDPPEHEQPSFSLRAVVKWVQRPRTTGAAFQVAAELEVPGNVWGISSPPGDWFPPQQPRVIEVSGPTVEPSTQPRAQPPGSLSRPDRGTDQLSSSRAMQATAPLSPLTAHLLGEFGEQFQRMVSEAAAAAVAAEADRLLGHLQTQLRNEVKEAMEGLAASHTDQWTRRMLGQINAALQATAKTLHEQWVKKIEQDLRMASERLAAQGTQLNQCADGLTAGAVERLQRLLEASQQDWMARFASRLQQQLAPFLEHAKGAWTKLAAYEQEVEQASATRRREFEESLQQSVLKCAARMQETSDRLARQFEQIIRDREAKTLEELERKGTAATRGSIESLQRASESYEKQNQNSLRAAIEPALAQAANELRKKAEEISRLFARELDRYCRSYLEHISGLIAELAKNTGSHPRV